MRNQNSDAPIKYPDNDLLGMNSHAELLAKFIAEIRPPFIIGIYGQWGEGKSSYVELTRYYLERVKGKDVIPVEFSAWPFTTSDELWRALTIKIAREICQQKPNNQSNTPQNIKEQPISTEEQEKTDGFLKSIHRFLIQDSFLFWEKETAQPKKNPCDDLGGLLKEGLSRSISRGTEKKLAINQEAALRAILGSVLAAVGSVSPVLAGLRGFLGFNQENKLADIVEQKKEKEPEKDFDSIDKLKNALNQLFGELAENKIVFVFIDDLDRCLPDVALDLLEAIKIFFEDVPCIFLVAADKGLIAQGLRLRYRDMFDQGDQIKNEELLTRKGDEYFEKIVQFGVSVPQRTPRQVHKFITAQYPKWASTTDIITMAIGNNPRRLKQYCEVLTFAFDASRRSGDTLEDQRST